MASKSSHVRNVTYEYAGDVIQWHEELRARALSDEGGLGTALDRTTSYYLMDDTGVRFNGSGLSETISGGRGNDILSGKRGDDVLLGSEGNDRLYGGHGRDTIYGDTGDDRLFGGQGNDTLVGGAGTNTLDGGDGVDTAVYGGVAQDYSINYSGSGVMIWGLGSTFINDMLFNVEFLQFGYDAYDINTWQAQGVSDPVQTSLSTNAAPIATDDSFNALEDTVLSGSVLGNDGDANGDALTVTAFNDATTAGGWVSVAADGSFVYTPAAHFSGADSFDYVVSDGKGGSAGASVSLNVAGVADTPTLSVPGGMTATFANGSDTLSVALDISAALTDNDGSELLRVRVGGLPTGATLSAGSLQGDGRWLLEAGEIAGVTVDLPPTVANDFQLAIFAEAQEFAGGAIAVNEGVVTVDVVAWGAETPEPVVIIPAAGQDIPGPFEGGAVLWVGAGQQYTDLQDAVDASGANDTIYIAAGTYDFGEVKIDHDVNIIGVGDVILTAADKVYKGALVTVSGVSLYVENLTFEGLHSWDRNGAGIRHQGADLVVVNSNFNGNENGILATGVGGGDVTIIGSSFVENGYGDGYSHGIYIKVAHVLRVEDSEFVGTKIGHHIKSMAAATVVRNSILDQADGQGSYSIDVTKGGDLLVEGNTIIQSADASNGTIISYYVTRGGEPGQVILSQNSITNLKDGGILLKNGTDAIAQIEGNTITNSSANALTLSFGLADKISNILNGTPVADESFDEFAISGTSGADVLQGTSAADVLNGNSGADHISGDAGRDLILGGDGNDWIDGGRDNDIIGGGAGNDVLIDGSGGDFLLGGDGADVFIAGLGKDYYNGGAGVDVAIFHHNYSDYTRVWQDEPGVRTYVRATEESGEYGSKSMTGVEYLQFRDGIYNTSTAVFTQNAFVIDPTVLADIESGAKLDFSIYASSSDDEVFVAGSGSDTFIFGAGSFGSDSIVDFDILNDRLLIDSSFAGSEFDVAAAAYGSEGELVLDFGSGNLIKLPGLTIGDVPNLDIDIDFG